MPALPSVNKVLRTALKWATGNDTSAYVRTFLSFTGANPTVVELAALATGILSEWQDFLTYLNEDGGLDEITITDLTSPTSAEATYSSPEIGTLTNGPLGAGSALVLSEVVDRRYRGGHSRLYIPDLDSGVLQTPQTFTSAFVGDMQTVADAVFAYYNTGGLWAGAGATAMCQVSYFEGFTNVLYPSGRYRNVPTLRAVPLVTPIAGIVVNPVMASQRRRNLQPVG